MDSKKKIPRIEQRRAYISSRLSNRHGSITSEVKRISRDLFISERQVWRDYANFDNNKK